MSVSIYEFFADLVTKRNQLSTCKELEHFPFDNNMILGRQKGKFPDLVLHAHSTTTGFYGGELIEIKDSKKSYTITSFNSSLPQGQKSINEVFLPANKTLKKMVMNGTDKHSMRDVFYLIRGHKNNSIKTCLVHGSFFETIEVEDNIVKSFSEVFNEAAKNSNMKIPDEVREILPKIFSKQEYFKKVRKVDKSSISLRFRIMAETRKESNLLDPKQYPKIIDNSLTLLMPLHNIKLEKQAVQDAQNSFTQAKLPPLKDFKIKHPFNGYFLCFQIKHR